MEFGREVKYRHTSCCVCSIDSLQKYIGSMEGKETDDDYDDRVNFGLKKTGGDSVAAPRKDPLTAQELVDKVQEFFYGSDELASYFENFVKVSDQLASYVGEERLAAAAFDTYYCLSNITANRNLLPYHICYMHHAYSNRRTPT